MLQDLIQNEKNHYPHSTTWNIWNSPYICLYRDDSIISTINIVLGIINTQGSQEQEVKFQDPTFRKFQDIFVGFTSLKTQKIHVFLSS